MIKNQLSVRLHGKPVGILEQTKSGKMTFWYSSPTIDAISLGMPVQAESYDELQCEAFFAGLLPESDEARKAIARRYGISFSNSFALLKAIGYDCAGAISFHEMDEPIVAQSSFFLDGKIISENDLYEHIKLLPQRPLFLGFEGLRLSLAGVHDKAAVCLIENQIALPEHNCPTTHILKPAIPNLEGIVENEYFCMKIAKRIGLSVPNVEIRQVKDIIFLLIERYDRQINDDQVMRIHQEDFCQVLGVVSSKKYQNEGGPSLKECFNLLKKTIQPAIDRNQLASIVIFNYLICNMDAHGKNFSLLHQKSNGVRLAPFYDIICTRIYPRLTAKMAMKVGGKYESDSVFPRHWERLCEDIGYSYPALKRMVIKQAQDVLKAAQQEREDFIQMKKDIFIIDKIMANLEKKVEQTLMRFSTDD